MSTHEGLPVAGYHSQTGFKVDLVNENKRIEERVLRQIDYLASVEGIDPRFLAIGRTQIEMGFMAVNRSVFQPGRIDLPEDTDGEIPQ